MFWEKAMDEVIVLVCSYDSGCISVRGVFRFGDSGSNRIQRGIFLAAAWEDCGDVGKQSEDADRIDCSVDSEENSMKPFSPSVHCHV